MKISVTPLYPTSSFLNVRLGIEKDVPDNCNLKEEVLSLWDNLTAIHMERYPNLYTKEGKPKYEGYVGEELPAQQIKEPETKLSKEEMQKKYLTDCTTPEELKTFEKLVKSNPHLLETYNEQLKKLTV